MGKQEEHFGDIILRMGAFHTICKFVGIDLFSLYFLFSHFRPRDVLKRISLLFFFYKLCIRMHVHKRTLMSSLFERNCSLE